MMRRHDSLWRTCATLCVALVCGLILEADGLRIWAERLPVGILRDAAVPVTATWWGWMAPLHAGAPRSVALQMKERLAGNAPETHALQPAVAPLPAAVSGTVTVGVTAIVAEGPVAGGTATSLAVSNLPEGRPAASGVVAWPPEDGGRLIALAGDSMMAVGLAPVLGRDLANDPNFRLLKAYRSGTGLARPEVFDWMQQYPLMLSGAQPQLVICSMGANDAQNVQIGKKVLEFGSEEWDAYYRSRLSAYLGMLGARQVRVLWVGMPLMKEKKFSQRMQHMNDVVRAEIASRPNVTWLDPNPVLGYSKSFEQYRANARGRMVKMRADDGIHMTDDGAAYLLPAIREWLEQVAQAGSLPGVRSGEALPQAPGSAPKA